jgi:hypothetical protein
MMMLWFRPTALSRLFPTIGFQIINEDKFNEGSSMPWKRLVV